MRKKLIERLKRLGFSNIEIEEIREEMNEKEIKEMIKDLEKEAKKGGLI